MTTRYRILVVEDDPAVAASLEDALTAEGYDVHIEGTAAGGLAFARDEGPHLVILDVRLPDGSGFDVVRSIRQQSLRMPVLMLTVQAEEVDQVLGLEMGADDYLAKPFRLRELLARIRSHLRRAYGDLASSHAEVLYVQDLVIDRTRGTVTRSGKDVGLTPVEMRLVTYLAQHPQQVFSRAQLIEQVWGMPANMYDDKSVTAHIRRLREKIETDPAAPQIIQTVPGLGYRLEP